MVTILFTEVEDIVELLGCMTENLIGALTQRTVEVKREKVKTDFSVAGVTFFLLLLVQNDIQKVYEERSFNDCSRLEGRKRHWLIDVMYFLFSST